MTTYRGYVREECLSPASVDSSMSESDSSTAEVDCAQVNLDYLAHLFTDHRDTAVSPALSDGMYPDTSPAPDSTGTDSDCSLGRCTHTGKTSTRKPCKYVPHREKPVHVVEKRNARERRRVEAVNSAFVKLRRTVPHENRRKRISKVKTLRVAIDYIHYLQDLIDDYDSNQIREAVNPAGPAHHPGCQAPPAWGHGPQQPAYLPRLQQHALPPSNPHLRHDMPGHPAQHHMAYPQQENVLQSELLRFVALGNCAPQTWAPTADSGSYPHHPQQQLHHPQQQLQQPQQQLQQPQQQLQQPQQQLQQPQHQQLVHTQSHS